MNVKCFMLYPTDRAWRSLRRYSKGVDAPNCPHGLHESMVPLDIKGGYDTSEGVWNGPADDEIVPHADPRWPTKCAHCDYQFKDDDAWQVFIDHIWTSDDGAEHSLRNPPVGAMWFAFWMTAPHWHGPDGKTLMVQTPGGQWIVDSQASNCTNKEDRGPFDKAHRCWVRHGTPPMITVDKNGHTCGAGAGSILSGSYHGFLRNGELTDC